MSSATEVGPAPGASVVRASRRGRNAVIALVAVVATLMGVGAGALVAWDAGYDGRILPGVSVGSTDLSGLDRGAAVAALEPADPFRAGTLVLQGPDGDLTISYAAVGRRADVDALVDRAMAAGRSGALPERAIDQVRLALSGRQLDQVVAIDEAALAAAIADAISPLNERPRDATIAMTPAGVIETSPARIGRSVDPAPVIAAAITALSRTDAPRELSLPIATTPVPPSVDDATVAAARTSAETMAQDLEVAFGDRTWTIRAARVRTWIRFEPAVGGAIVPVIDERRIPAVFGKSIAKAVKEAPKSAQYLVARSGKVVGVVASSTGRTFDPKATAAAVTAALEERAAGSAPAPVQVRTAVVLPKLSTEQAATKAPVMSLLGSWQTRFPISERNFNGANIWIPAQLINGTVLQPGQRFDWWDAIWPVTPARGFGPGGIIRVDHTEPTGALGGGMCSSSTTLFNAAMRAGLDIGQRYNHRYYIDRYPLGLDATVSIVGGSRQSMTFRNDTRHAIFIRGTKIRAGGTGWVRYEIWGIPDGRTVTLSRPAVTNVRKAVTREVLVDTLPTGVREQVEYPSNAMTVTVNRLVRDASGRVLHRNTWVSRYVLWNGIVNVGR